MDDPPPLSLSKRAASFRTAPVSNRLPRAVAMPSWRTHAAPPPDCVLVVIKLPRGRVQATARAPGARCLHAYGAHGASALCGASDWRELVPPDEATCPLCRTRLGREGRLALH